MALLAVLVADNDPAGIAASIAQLSWRLAIVVAFPAVLVQVADAVGWRYAFHEGAVPVPRLMAVRIAGEAFNIVPPAGELYCDMRAENLDAFDRVLRSLPDEVGGVQLEPELVRVWPGMDARPATSDLLAGAGELLGRPIVAIERGGASDASHMAQHVPLTVDGLGPRGGGAHNPDEYVLRESLGQRAQVACAIAAAVLG